MNTQLPTLHYTLAPDLVSATCNEMIGISNARRQRKWLNVLMWTVIFLLLFVVLQLGADSVIAGPVRVGAASFVAGVALCFVVFWWKQRSARRLLKFLYDGCTVQLEITPEEIREDLRGSTISTHWRNVEQIVETRDAIVILHAPILTIVPKTALPEGLDPGSFCATLKGWLDDRV